MALQIWTFKFSGFKYALPAPYGIWFANNESANKTVQGLHGREEITSFIPKEEYLEGYTVSITNSCRYLWTNHTYLQQRKRYLLTFINDFSRKTWIYFLTEKLEALNVFKNFKIHVEKEADSLIRGLRTDRGGEFTSQDFTNFCCDNGIRRQLTAAYRPQQNGIAERKNRTIMNMVRSMLSEKKMPKTFWAEAATWSVHILNRCPTLAVENKMPEEAWSGVKPSVKYFRVFGCIFSSM